VDGDEKGDAVADEARIREILERYFEFTGADVERAEELYHEDAVLEFPQSGERFEGRAKFTEWRSQYPVGADDLRYKLGRVTVREDFSAVEMTASYDRGETWMYGVQLVDYRDDKIIRERIYVAEGWEPPEWRAPWRSETPAG
jgi:SnoaL-like domain